MWFEDIPEKCPPERAIAPQGNYYRLIEGDEITCRDFWSHRKQWPDRHFHVGECRARSVSVFSDLNECDKLKKMKLHANKKVALIKLDRESGKVQQTGGNKKHYSWWRALGFDPVTSSEIVA